MTDWVKVKAILEVNTWAETRARDAIRTVDHTLR